MGFVVCVAAAPSAAQCRLIDKNRDSVFITFERVVELWTEETIKAQDGVLLRLHNNSSCPVSITTSTETGYYVPRSSFYFYPPIRVPSSHSKHLYIGGGPRPDGALVLGVRYSFTERGKTKHSGWSHVSGGEILSEGQNILFGVPLSHLDLLDLNGISVTFDYIWEQERPPPGGHRYGSVDHSVRFGVSSLPEKTLLELKQRSISGRKRNKYGLPRAIWFAAIGDPNKPDWEILPQEARGGGGYFVEAE
ncbi:MAG: hypothetical protein IPG67_09615 [Acidobacteria bacterium]|nr:hypothetical protein [Acidobacteriota bacterium]